MSKANPKIRTVLFDLDDTLYNRGEAFRGWAAGFVDATAPRLSVAERDEAISWLASVDERGYCPRPDFVARVQRRFPDTPEPSVDEFVSAFRAVMLTRIELESGTRRLLDALSMRAIPWGIITNGLTDPQQRKVDRLGLSDRAACVVISEAFGVKKPNPAIFTETARRLGVANDEVLFVGDHVVNDIGGARQAGMQTAWLRRGRDWPAEYAATPPDFTIDDLQELIPVINQDL